MRRLQLIILVLLTAGLMACKSTVEQPVAASVSPHQYLYDEAFPGYDWYSMESEEEIFHLDEEAKEFVQDILRAHDDEPDKQMKALIRSIFDRSEFNLLYLASANTTANETFHNRSANCLSMSIMTYAMAREAGYGVKFQDILIPEYWTRRAGYSLLNGHVNLLVSPKLEPNVVRLFNTGVVVDFDPQNTRRHFPKRTVSKNTVMAMYFNNKGADALLSNSYTKAYAYFREAIKQDPNFDSPWVNLGFLYRLNDHYGYAEQSYERALEIDPENLTAWENKAYLYQYSGREAEAQQILTRVENKRDSNPFYHFILGEQEFDAGNIDLALGHYRRALQLDKGKHEIYFGLAKTYFEMGDINKSHHYLKIAQRRAKNPEDRQRYQGKLALFSSL